MNESLMNSKGYSVITLGAALSFLSVAAGAFGAHAVKSMLSVELFAIYETAVEYQFYHSMALLIAGLMMVLPLAVNLRYLKLATYCFVIGIVLFSGSLYLYAFTGLKKLGMITPVGGVCFLAGWVMLGLSSASAVRKERH
ncbi:DUF423 domain-containing protein [Alkalimarinus coralli]|uniref:DUF423 domain-containing protein n=1 Tax=Alkalimarinus coralli TaxID=2935863 RepID=UPI00202ACA56|nr:DUF423 domain-containing protein [Alkalimarinus coralli]